ncbi:MAG: SUMF1/EgtB/PvdO family nonheme iron enzyme [Hyphomicrobium sp.]
MGDAGAAEQNKLKVFISYSRKDDDFAQELLTGLKLVGFEPYLDKHDIAAGEDWEARLGRLIEAADTVVFVISPDAVASERCGWEVERTVELKKRLLPVVWRRVEEAQVPQRLKQLNYIFFDKPLMSVPSLSALATALRTDLGWIREHTRIGEAALRWEGHERNEALLFRGDELAAAKTWLASQPQYAPEPTMLHHAFIKAGEDAEVARMSIERQRLDDLRSALDREKAAQTERGKALDREKAALQKGRRLQAAVGALMLIVIVSLLGVIFKEPIGDFVFEQTTLRKYVATQVRPHVLTAEVERALMHGATFRECKSACPEMVVVPAGSFRMGSPDNEAGHDKDEAPMRTVTFTKPFAVGKFEVTWDDWEACVAMRGCDGEPTGDAGFGKGRKPVVNVSWYQARSYVTWLSRVTSRDYRLLTEAEWEYAARAGKQTTYSFGDDPGDLCKHANLADHSYRRRGYTREIFNCDDGQAETAPVGSYPANAFGLHDMHGNVWEWVHDCYVDSYNSARTDGTSLPEENGCRRVRRGGSWYGLPLILRAADRSSILPDTRGSDVGFRVARTLNP